jgi:hypothetical protein
MTIHLHSKNAAIQVAGGFPRFLSTDVMEANTMLGRKSVRALLS